MNLAPTRTLTLALSLMWERAIFLPEGGKMEDMTISIPFRPCQVLYKTSRRWLSMKLNGYPQVLLTSWSLSSKPNRAPYIWKQEWPMTAYSGCPSSGSRHSSGRLHTLAIGAVLEKKMINDSICEYQSRRNDHGPHGFVVHLQILSPRNH